MKIINQAENISGNNYQTVNIYDNEETIRRMNSIEKKLDFIISVIQINSCARYCANKYGLNEEKHTDQC